nr:hypothetical protein CFP56_56510 [Quercus suber]
MRYCFNCSHATFSLIRFVESLTCRSQWSSSKMIDANQFVFQMITSRSPQKETPKLLHQHHALNFDVCSPAYSQPDVWSLRRGSDDAAASCRAKQESLA